MTGNIRERAYARVERFEERLPAGCEFLVVSKHVPIPVGLKLSSGRGLGFLRKHFGSEDTSVGSRTYIIAALGILIAAALALLIGLGAAATVHTTPEPSALNNPKNALLIPGINKFLPIAATGYILAAITLSAGVHELAHVIAGLKHGVDVEEWGIGILFGVIPLGAFVTPEEDGFDNLPRLARMEVYGIAPLVNLIFATWFWTASVRLPGTVSREVATQTWQAFAVQSSELFFPTFGNPVTDLCMWVGFISVNLGLFNLIPIKPLDGGHVLSEALSLTAEKVGYSADYGQSVSRGVMYLALVGLLALLFLPHAMGVIQ